MFSMRRLQRLSLNPRLQAQRPAATTAYLQGWKDQWRQPSVAAVVFRQPLPTKLSYSRRLSRSGSSVGTAMR